MNGETLHLVAHVAGRGVLFDVRRLDSVVDLPPVVPVPGAPATVRGLAALRSRVATVLETGALLGLGAGEGAGSGGRAVVTNVDGHLYAFAVDTLEEVASLTLDAPPSGMSLSDGWKGVSAIADGGEETLMALDVERLVQRALATGAS